MSKRKLDAEERAKVFKALSDPRRVDIVDALAKNGALSGTELAGELGISIALLCHHWEVLVDAGILKKKRVGQTRVCSLDSERLRDAAAAWDAPAPPETPPTSPKRSGAKKKTKKKSAQRP